MRSSSRPRSARKTITTATSDGRSRACRCRASKRIATRGTSSCGCRVPRIAAATRPRSWTRWWRRCTGSARPARCGRSWSGASVLADHQREAVRRASEILDRHGGVLLADEPGLGKSFVAAEIARREERRGGEVEAIVPAPLVAQWHETMRMFGISARIITRDAIVTDTRLAAPVRRLIIVDEAHAFRTPKTQRYDALARRSAGARMLLVTATPLCNSTSDVRALIELIAADDAVAGRGVPSIDAAFERDDREAIATIVGELVIRRDRVVLPPELQFGSLEARVIRYEVPDVRQWIDALRFPLVGERQILRQFLWRRLESSEAALLESVRRQRRFYERALECLAAGRALPKREYRRA